MKVNQRRITKLNSETSQPSKGSNQVSNEEMVLDHRKMMWPVLGDQSSSSMNSITNSLNEVPSHDQVQETLKDLRLQINDLTKARKDMKRIV